jgi:acyl-CoA hydrolase
VTLQIGIGAVPGAVLGALCGRTGMAVWSEMLSDGVLALERAGALDPSNPATASFAFGSADLYSWVDRNPRVRMLHTEKANDPGSSRGRPPRCPSTAAPRAWLGRPSGLAWLL